MKPFRIWKSDQLFRFLHSGAAARQFTSASSPRSFSQLIKRPRATVGSYQSSQDSLYLQRSFFRRFHQALLRRAEQQHPPNPNPTPHLGSPPPAPSLGERFRKLSREYGWSAVGVYFLLSALDFPFCFAAVRLLGTERIGRWEHAIVSNVMAMVKYPFKGDETQAEEPQKVVMKNPGGGFPEDPKLQEWSWGVEEAQEEASKSDATIWTQLALAYAVHKSFIFIRIPLTAAVLPRVVKVLRGWGWDIGKRRSKDKVVAAAATKKKD